MEENPQDISNTPKSGRKSLEELLREAEAEAQKYETATEHAVVDAAFVPTGDGELPGLQMASLRTIDTGEDVVPVQEDAVVTPLFSQEIEDQHADVVSSGTMQEEILESTTNTVETAVSENEIHDSSLMNNVPSPEEQIDTGVSLEEIEKELRRSQLWEEEQKRNERRKRLQKVPVLPVVLSVLFVLFTTLFFTNPGGSVLAPLQVRFLASIVEGNGRIFTEGAAEVTERTQLRVGDIIQTYEAASTVEFFDKTRIVLFPETQIEIRGMSREEKRIQIALLAGQVWVDDRDVRTTLEIFAHARSANREVQGFYRSLLGSYLLTRADELVDAYAVTAPLYIILEKEEQETSTLIPPYAAARIADSQLKPNVFDLEYSKAKTEFRIRSYLRDYQQTLQCTGMDCAETGVYHTIETQAAYSLGYALQLQIQGEFLVRGVALGQSALRVALQEWFPYLTISHDKIERETFVQMLSVLALALEDMIDAPTNPGLQRQLQAVLEEHVRDYQTWERVRPLFLVVENALPTDPLYAVKEMLDTLEMNVMTKEQQLLALQERFVERNNEFYRLLLRNQTEYIVAHLPTYLVEVHQFVETHPDSMRLMEDARILADNMLIAVPKLYETAIFAERFKLEALELQLVEQGRRDPLRLEFARTKIDVMQQLYREITTTTNAYLRQLYIARMDQLITQFDQLRIEQITFAVGPVRVLQSEFTGLRRDYLTLRGVAPSEDAEALKDTTQEILDVLANRPVSRVPEEVIKTQEEIRRELATKAQQDLREVGLGLRIVSQDPELARVFSVSGSVMAKPFTAVYNAETGAFSQIQIGTERIATVIDKRYMTVFMENTAKPKEDTTDTTATVEQRNYYREQLQVARRQRVYELLLRNNVQLARVSDIRPFTTDSTDLFYVSNATTTVTLSVAEGKENLATERSFILQFHGVYNIQDDTLREVVVSTSGYSPVSLGQQVAVNRLVTTIHKQFTDAFYKETYMALARKLLETQGIQMDASTELTVSGPQFTLYAIPLVAVEVSGATDPIMLQGNLDVLSGNLFEVRWTYQGKTYSQLTLPVQELRATLQQMLRSLQEERERQVRLEQERQRQLEEERLRKQREQQQRQFENEALQFFEGGTSRNN